MEQKYAHKDVENKEIKMRDGEKITNEGTYQIYALPSTFPIPKLMTKKGALWEGLCTHVMTLASSINSSSLIVPSFIILTATSMP